MILNNNILDNILDEVTKTHKESLKKLAEGEESNNTDNTDNDGDKKNERKTVTD